MTIVRIVAILFTLLVAELFGSWSVWFTAPTDSIRVQYNDFRAFASPRVAICLALMLCLMVISKGRNWLNHSLKTVFFSGVCLQLMTTFLYWRLPQSYYLRSLFESFSFGNVTAPDVNYDFYSSLLYWTFHVIPWAVIVAATFAIWAVRTRLHSRRKLTLSKQGSADAH